MLTPHLECLTSFDMPESRLDYARAGAGEPAQAGGGAPGHKARAASSIFSCSPHFSLPLAQELENLHKLEVVHLENFLDGQVQAGKAVPLKNGFRRKKEALFSTNF